jgi:O-antigen ligase
MPAWLTDFLGDRIQINSVLIVLCFVSVLVLSSQSAASYPSYLLALSMLVSVRSWNDVFRLRLVWVILGFLAFLCVSALWSQTFTWRGLFSISARALLVFLFVVALAECQLRGQVQLWLGRVLAVVGTGAAVAAIVLYWSEPPPGGRLSGFGQLDNPVVIGLILGAVLVMLAHLLMSDPDRRWRWIGVFGASTVFYAIYLSGSRNAMVSSLLGVMVLFFSTRIRDPQRFSAASAACLILGLAMLAALLNNEASRELLLPRGDSFRLGIWSDVLARIFSEGPIFGFGILTVDMVQVEGLTFSHPHNMYLAVLFQGGVTALILFLILIVGTVDRLFASYSQRAAKLAIGLLAMALSSYMFDGHEIIDKVGETWFLFWLPVGISLGLSWVHSMAVVPEDEI